MTLIGEHKLRDSEPARLLATHARVHVPAGHLRLTERFWSVEGEGLLTGAPTYLVRFAGCNLRCGQCDTKYSSWYDNDYEMVSGEALGAEIRALPGSPWVSYTGGEPLFRGADELHTLGLLVTYLDMWGYRQKLETSGTVVPPTSFPSHQLFWSIAPKVGAGMGRGTYCDTGRLRELLEVHARPAHAHVKFVLGAETYAADLDCVRALLREVEALWLYPLVLTPEGLTDSTVEYIRRYTTLVEHVRAHGGTLLSHRQLRVLPQMHQIMWRNERGR